MSGPEIEEAAVFDDRHWIELKDLRKKQTRSGDIAAFRSKYYQAQFTVPRWQKLLKDVTFETEILYLSSEEHKALRKLVRDTLTGLGKAASGSSEQRGDVHLELLKQRLDEVILGKFKGAGCFAKLGSRSPKDSLIYSKPRNTSSAKESLPATIQSDLSKRYEEIVKREFEFLLRRSSSLPSKSAVVAAFSIAQTKAGCLQSGKELLDVFSNSFRIVEDLTSGSAFAEMLESFLGCIEGLETDASGSWRECIVLRKWEKWVANHPESEFRGFVYKGCLTACTQYFSDTLFPDLVASAPAVAKKIGVFFRDKVQPALAQSYESYVVDFCVGPGEEMRVIELNPFHGKAGAGLFDWRNDRKLLFGAHTQSTPKAEEQHYQDHVESGGGSQQFVFRILKKEKPDAVENNIPGPWWRHLKQTFPALAGVEDTASQAECGGEALKACCSLQ